MRNLTELGFREWNKRPFPRFTDATLRSFEEHFAIRLPDDYLSFICFANGGTFDICQYDDPVTGGIGEVNDFYGLGSRESNEKASTNGKWEYGNLWGETQSFNMYLLKGDRTTGVPFARDGGGNKLFLDYRGTNVSVSRLVSATHATYRLAS